MSSMARILRILRLLSTLEHADAEWRIHPWNEIKTDYRKGRAQPEKRYAPSSETISSVALVKRLLRLDTKDKPQNVFFFSAD